MPIYFLNGERAAQVPPMPSFKLPRCIARTKKGQCTAGAGWLLLVNRKRIPVCRTHANKAEKNGVHIDLAVEPANA